MKTHYRRWHDGRLLAGCAVNDQSAPTRDHPTSTLTTLSSRRAAMPLLLPAFLPVAAGATTGLIRLEASSVILRAPAPSLSLSRRCRTQTLPSLHGGAGGVLWLARRDAVTLGMTSSTNDCKLLTSCSFDSPASLAAAAAAAAVIASMKRSRSDNFLASMIQRRYTSCLRHCSHNLQQPHL